MFIANPKLSQTGVDLLYWFRPFNWSYLFHDVIFLSSVLVNIGQPVVDFEVCCYFCQ